MHCDIKLTNLIELCFNDQIRKYHVKYKKTKVKPNNKEFTSHQDESRTF